jgi:hypothetical protein
MDETNAEAVMHDPSALDLATCSVPVDAGGCLTLDLLPYAVACIDAGK